MATSVDQNEKDLLAAVDRVGDWQGKAFRYEPVKGGITNPNWKVVVDDSAFFVKIPGRGTEVFIDRRNCHAANLIAEKAGIGPRVRYFFEDTGVEIFEFMEGYRTLDYGDVYKRDLFYKIIEVARRFPHPCYSPSDADGVRSDFQNVQHGKGPESLPASRDQSHGVACQGN